MTDIPPKVWALLSGGKDSVAMTSVLSDHGRLAGALFIDTGIACPDTCPFVRDLCQSRGWPLKVLHPPRTYEELVTKWGFPKNVVGHSWAYAHLKERALRVAWKELPPEEKMFASGVRRKESARRKRTVGRGFRHNGGIQIINPIQEWSTRQVWAYLKEKGLPVSPSYLFLGRSGDCLCGSFSHREEAGVIKRAYPELAERITALEDSVATKFPFPKNRWGSDRSVGGFSKFRGRMTLEEAVCGGDCVTGEGRE